MQEIGQINFLVGPNGSGKSQFAFSLHRTLGNSRILSTDRLRGMGQYTAFNYFAHDPFANGYDKQHFPQLTKASNEGSGIEAFVLIASKLDLRIKIEATLSHLFGRDIILEWDSGRLIPKMALRDSGVSYRLDHDECHGIKELLVLLTFLYDDTYSYLIIDEPELNLHPQYQAFFMEEVRKISGGLQSTIEGKIIFLITHSPFILDLQTEDDVKSIISFTLDGTTPPQQVARLNLGTLKKLLSMVRRLNAHHKQIFFSDNPLLVEGLFDAQFVEAM